MFESGDESIFKLHSVSKSSYRCEATFDTGRHGATTLTIYPRYNPGAKRVINIVVKGANDIDVTGITLNKASVDLYMGGTKTAKVTATVSPSDAFIKKVKWVSTNNNIAKVDSNGNVTGVAKGTAYIYAKATDGSGKNC